MTFLAVYLAAVTPSCVKQHQSTLLQVLTIFVLDLQPYHVSAFLQLLGSQGYLYQVGLITCRGMAGHPKAGGLRSFVPDDTTSCTPTWTPFIRT